ncbi:MAG: CoA transferase [Frankia sp.]
MERRPTPVTRGAATRAGDHGFVAEPRDLAALLRAQGLPVPGAPTAAEAAAADQPIADWARSGLMWLTGRPDGPPLAPTGPVLARARASAGILDAFGPLPSGPSPHGRATGGGSAAAEPSSAELTSEAPSGVPASGTSTVGAVDLVLGGRAALLGLTRRGAVSANGTCRLARCADGWVALNLARPDDADLVGALLERDLGPPAGDGSADGGTLELAWAAFAIAARERPAADLVDRARLLGLPAAALAPRPASRPGPAVARSSGQASERPCVAVHPIGRPRTNGPASRPIVLDLSALWAGPLCARLLGDAGLRVIKLESVTRPDGARAGNRTFYDWLHGGHASVAVDFTSRSGLAALAALVARADVVIESTRPRALAQLGIDAWAVVAARPGVTWVSVTGYGRDTDGGPGAVAFGDDAAVAGGLVAWDDYPAGGATPGSDAAAHDGSAVGHGGAGAGGQRSAGRPVFCADAIADPLTGLYAAAAARASVAAGGGHLLEVSMSAVAAHANASGSAGPGPAEPDRAGAGAVRATQSGSDGRWWVGVGNGRIEVAPPRGPSRSGLRPAAALGADTRAVLAELGTPG